MKKPLLLLMLVAITTLVFTALSEASPYFKTIIGDPAHPKMSASLLYTADLEFDGGVTDVAIIYHKANPNDTLWPKRLLALGMVPLSWTLLELGFGGNGDSAFLRGGASIDVAPTLLGPLTDALKRAGGKYAAFGKFLSNPNGSGMKLSLGWKADVIQKGKLVQFDELRFPPRYGVGYTYQF